MRVVGKLKSEEPAQRFGDYLTVKGIENEIEAGKDGDWLVWVHDDEQLEAAGAAFARFEQQPDDAEFSGLEKKARGVRDQVAKEDKEARRKVVDVRTTRWLGEQMLLRSPLTLGMILFSVGVGVASWLGQDDQLLRPLFISNYVEPRLPEIMHGQVWRVVTPIFMHFGLLHLLFNMMWLFDLGGMIERRRGTLYFALLVLAIAVLSNLAQYFFVSPSFGGMSGVVFGLFGYIWIRNKYDYSAGYPLRPNTVTLMLVWLVVCMLGFVGSIANHAHTVGLLVGMAWGFVVSDTFQRMMRR